MWKTRWKVWTTLAERGSRRRTAEKLCRRSFCIKPAESGWAAGKIWPLFSGGPVRICRKAAAPCRRRRRPLHSARGPSKAGGSGTRPYGPHPPRCARHLPLNGKACGRPKAAPTAGDGPSALVRQSQARFWTRNSDNFCIPRAQWPGLNSGKSLKFCAPEMFCPVQGVTPVNGVRGKATMSTKCSSGAVPGGSLVTFWPSRKSLAARRRRNPPAIMNPAASGWPGRPGRRRRRPGPGRG